MTGGHQPGVFIDPKMGRSREADAALIVEAVNNYDRLRAIEKAARVVCDPMVQDGGGDRWWSAIAALRAALEGDTDE